IAWRISPTLSPTCGVGASDRSTIPNATPRRAATSRPISSPTRVTRNAVLLISSAISPSVACGRLASRSSTAALPTPRPPAPRLARPDAAHAVRPPPAVAPPRHERIVRRRVREDHQLRATEPVVFLGPFGSLLEHLPEREHRVHVDPRRRGTDIHARAHAT